MIRFDLGCKLFVKQHMNTWYYATICYITAESFCDYCWSTSLMMFWQERSAEFIFRFTKTIWYCHSLFSLVNFVVMLLMFSEFLPHMQSFLGRRIRELLGCQPTFRLKLECGDYSSDTYDVTSSNVWLFWGLVLYFALFSSLLDIVIIIL